MPPLDLVSATDLIQGDLKAAWDAGANAIVQPAYASATLVFEQLEKNLNPHPRSTGLPWGRITVRHGAGARAAIGNRLFVRNGNAFVQLFVPFKGPEDQEKAQRLGMLVQVAYEKAGGAVDYRSVSVMEEGPDAGFYRVDCVVAFRWYETRN